MPTKRVSLLFKPLHCIFVSVATSQWTDEDPKDLPWVCGTNLKFGLFEAFDWKGHPCRKTINFTRPSIPQFFWLTPACASPVLLEAHCWFGEALAQTPRQEQGPWKHEHDGDDQTLYGHGCDDGDDLAKVVNQTCEQIHCFGV